MENRIKVKDYGDMLAKCRNMELLHYECYGSYQGQYLAILLDKETNPNRIFIYKDCYGSCSGCDFLESEIDWETETIDYKEANDYCSQMRPLFILPVKKYKKEDFEILIDNDSGDFEFSKEDAINICKIINNSINND